ncbi:MAG: alpha/beta hydrolase [Sphingomonas sp. 28-66-16]|nr:MAG: alpha/beta hydrolase [Sphingomonas sp. 28-66-16]
MRITRHFVDIGGRRVHYRRCGEGPALLMVHQSPRSSAEYESLMRQWGGYFTCIAPDTPGFGQSDPLPADSPTIDDFADALADLLDSLGIDRVPAYGFHSGAIILVTALKRHPARFSRLAAGGYAIWTAEESALFSDRYLPPFEPSDYGEHLTWLWNRLLEQSWFFPWFAVTPAHRLNLAHADIGRVDAAVRDMLDSGAAYRAGYGAVLRAPRDIPPADAVTPPVLITAYDGDPLQAHIDRLGTMPAGWAALKVASVAEHQLVSLAFLRAGHPDPRPVLVDCPDEGFWHVTTAAFDGLIHWRGRRGGTLHLHAPGRALDLLGAVDGLAIDLPGHGLSDRWPDAVPTHWAPWQAVIDGIAAQFGCSDIVMEPAPAGDPERLFPDLAPDRFGSYLTRAWAIVRAGHFFEPWYETGAAAARAFVADEVAAGALAREHRALIRASSARECLIARRSIEGGS